VITEEDINDFLEHHGVKGQKWGIRNAKRAGQGAKAVGRGAQKTAHWVRTHPRSSVAIGASVFLGARFTAHLLQQNKMTVAALPSWSATDKQGLKIFGPADHLAKIKVKDLPKLKDNPFGLGIERFPAVPMGPVGSTSISRLAGAIPLPKVGG
jgi:hypothetical protein